MSLGRTLKSAAPYIVHYSGAGRALASRYGGLGVIFMLHSIVGEPALYLEDMRCPIAVLERTLRWLRDNDVEFVSLDEALERLEQPQTRKFCAFTFDDGYADNLSLALPLMQRFEAPFTVYVTPGLMTGEIDAWWLGLATLIRIRDQISLPDLNFHFDCPDHVHKRRAFRAIEAMVHSNYELLAPVKTAVAAEG